MSGVTTAYTQVHTNQETVRSKKEELRKLAIGLVEIRQESLNSAIATSDGNSLLKAKQGVYLQAAERLTGEIPEFVSAYEYILLATEHASDGNYTTARAYLSKAADAATTPSQRPQALRILAIMYFSPGPLRNQDQARATFAQAIEGEDRH